MDFKIAKSGFKQVVAKFADYYGFFQLSERI